MHFFHSKKTIIPTKRKKETKVIKNKLNEHVDYCFSNKTNELGNETFAQKFQTLITIIIQTKFIGHRRK